MTLTVSKNYAKVVFCLYMLGITLSHVRLVNFTLGSFTDLVKKKKKKRKESDVVMSSCNHVRNESAGHYHTCE